MEKQKYNEVIQQERLQRIQELIRSLDDEQIQAFKRWFREWYL